MKVTPWLRQARQRLNPDGWCNRHRYATTTSTDGAFYAASEYMPRPRIVRRAPTIAEVTDYLAREAKATIKRSDALRRELDERLAAFEKIVRHIQLFLRQPESWAAR